MITCLKEKDGLPFVWMDMTNPTKEELAEIAATYNLHKALVEDSLQPEHLPKYERIGNIQFLILRIYSSTATHKADTIQKLTDKVAVFIDSGFIITIHRLNYNFLEQIRDQHVATGKCATAFDVLQHIIHWSFLTYDEPLHGLIREIEAYEPRMFLEKKIPSLLQDLYLVKRQAYVINRILNLSKAILENLHDKIQPPDLNNLRDTLLRLHTNSDQIMDNSATALNTYISLTSQRTNEVVRVLTLFSVFFMPLTFIVGIYGMNFDFMPELGWPLGYYMVLLVMIAVTVAIYVWFRRKGWM